MASSKSRIVLQFAASSGWYSPPMPSNRRAWRMKMVRSDLARLVS